jgi:hypothetical protein
MNNSLSLSFDLKETDSEISRKIVDILKPQIDQYFKDILQTIQPKLVTLVMDAIRNAPEYDSLANGRLKAEFGIPNSVGRVESILKFWENIEVKYKKVSRKGDGLVGGFSLQMIKSDFSDVISLPDAILTTEKGTALNWLEWLLLFGNQVIIKDYNVQLGSFNRSRTGMAIMSGAISGKWSVPSEFAGVITNNWITRSIDSVSNEIESLFLNSMK